MTSASPRFARMRRHRAFVLGSAATALLLLLTGGAFLAGGRTWLEQSLEQGGALGGALGQRNENLGVDLDLTGELYGSFVTVVLSAWAFAALLYFLHRGRVRWTRRLLGLVLFYVALEHLAAPRLRFVLQLTDYYFVQNLDHRPTSTDPAKGWNQDSLRTPHQPEDFRPEGLNLLFLGDSFTFGLGLPPESSFPAKVERYLQRALPAVTVRVANFGWTSSSPYLSRRRLEDIGAKYHPDFVLMCVDMSDFRDEIQYRNIRARRGLYRAWAHFPLAMKLFQSVAPTTLRRWHYALLDNTPRKRFFVTEAPLERNRPYLAPMRESLDGLHSWCEEHGAKLVVFVLPRGYQYSKRESPASWEARHYTPLGPHCHEPFRWFEEQAREVDYPIHSLLPAFQQAKVFPTCFPDDPHWNDAGTEIAARAIYNALATPIQQHLQGGP